MPTSTDSLHTPRSRGLDTIAAALLAAAVLTPGSLTASDVFQGFDQRSGERREMVDSQLRDRGIVDPKVISAMQAVPRHLFLPGEVDERAYEDIALPIGADQSVPQPYLVALTAQLLELDGDERVLEIGTGSGYQSAILSSMAAEVYSVEIVPELAQRARERLAGMGFTNVEVRTGDGYLGWPEKAPFDCILVTAAPRRIPQPLIDQLAVGGKLVIPVGDYLQDLIVVTRTEDGIEKRRVDLVRMDPMTRPPAQRRRR